MKGDQTTFVELGGDAHYRTVFIQGVNCGHKFFVIGADKSQVEDVAVLIESKLFDALASTGIKVSIGRERMKRPCGCAGS